MVELVAFGVFYGFCYGFASDFLSFLGVFFFKTKTFSFLVLLRSIEASKGIICLVPGLPSFMASKCRRVLVLTGIRFIRCMCVYCIDISAHTHITYIRYIYI